jgi:hypothetical protein
LMAVNVERFKNDLKQLIERGQRLELAMLMDLIGSDEFKNQYLKKIPDDQARAIMGSFPDFKSTYDDWYSEGVALIKQLLPDRLADFKSFYEKPKGRKSIAYENYVIQDFMQGLIVRSGIGETKVDPSAALPQYKQQLAILRAAERRFDSSLFEMRQLVQADPFRQ